MFQSQILVTLIGLALCDFSFAQEVEVLKPNGMEFRVSIIGAPAQQIFERMSEVEPIELGGGVHAGRIEVKMGKLMTCRKLKEFRSGAVISFNCDFLVTFDGNMTSTFR